MQIRHFFCAAGVKYNFKNLKLINGPALYTLHATQNGDLFEALYW